MSRLRQCRRVAQLPQCTYYKPRGVAFSALQQVVLTVDEFEAVRLTDLECLYQVQAAEKMNISRQTLGRILDSAHKKIADALVNGKALQITGGRIELTGAASCDSIAPRGHCRGRGGRGQFGRRGL